MDGTRLDDCRGLVCGVRRAGDECVVVCCPPMAFIGPVVRLLIRRAAADPRVQRAAAETAATAVQQAREIASDPSPARRLGRLAGRAKRRLAEAVRSED